MKPYLILFFSCISCLAAAQGDTILLRYSSEVNFARINEMTPSQFHKIGFTQRTTTGYTAFVADTKGRVMHERVLDSVENYTNINCSYIIDDTTRYVYISSAKREGKFYCLIFALDTALQNLTIIDVLPLEDNTQLWFNMMKYNPYKALWEGFGIVEKANVGITDNCYIGLDNDYRFNYFERLTGQFYKNHIIEFIWVEPAKRYVVCSFTGFMLLTDENFQVLKQLQLRYEYQYEGIGYNTFDDMMSCETGADGMPICYSKGLSRNVPLALSFSKLRVESDTILLEAHIPINQPSLDITHATQMRRDRKGDYVISGVDAVTFGQAPNKIRVVKFSPDYQRIWEFTYAGTGSFAIWDMDIDENNDIIMAGEIWEAPNSNKSAGFLMKVYANGSLTSWEEIPIPAARVFIVPNPAVSRFCIHSEGASCHYVCLYDASGRRIGEYSTTESSTRLCFNLPPSLPSGFYAVEIRLEDGRRLTRKLMVVK